MGHNGGSALVEIINERSIKDLIIELKNKKEWKPKKIGMNPIVIGQSMPVGTSSSSLSSSCPQLKHKSGRIEHGKGTVEESKGRVYTQLVPSRIYAEKESVRVKQTKNRESIEWTNKNLGNNI